MGNEATGGISEGREISKMDFEMKHKLSTSRGLTYNLKIILKGDKNTGKTALWTRLQGKPLAITYLPTPEIQVGTLNWNYKNTDDVVKIEVWDCVDKYQPQKANALKFENHDPQDDDDDEIFAQAQKAAEMARNLSTKKINKHGKNVLAKLDATVVDVYRGTHCAVLLFDCTKPWTFDYVKREIPHIPLDCFIIVCMNHFDKPTSEHKIAKDEVEGWIEDQRKIRFGDQIDKYIFLQMVVSSMTNAFGLKTIVKLFNFPFLYLQRESLLVQLQRNADENKVVEQEVTFEREESYQQFLINRSKRLILQQDQELQNHQINVQQEVQNQNQKEEKEKEEGKGQAKTKPQLQPQSQTQSQTQTQIPLSITPEKHSFFSRLKTRSVSLLSPNKQQVDEKAKPEKNQDEKKKNSIDNFFDEGVDEGWLNSDEDFDNGNDDGNGDDDDDDDDDRQIWGKPKNKKLQESTKDTQNWGNPKKIPNVYEKEKRKKEEKETKTKEESLRRKEPRRKGERERHSKRKNYHKGKERRGGNHNMKEEKEEKGKEEKLLQKKMKEKQEMERTIKEKEMERKKEMKEEKKTTKKSESEDHIQKSYDDEHLHFNLQENDNDPSFNVTKDDNDNDNDDNNPQFFVSKNDDDDHDDDDDNEHPHFNLQENDIDNQPSFNVTKGDNDDNDEPQFFVSENGDDDEDDDDDLFNDLNNEEIDFDSAYDMIKNNDFKNPNTKEEINFCQSSFEKEKEDAKSLKNKYDQL